MKTEKKLTSWYFLLVFSLILLVTVIYSVMNKIEGFTTTLENHIKYRDLSYIVDKTYTLEKKKQNDQGIQFLNNLTDFFYNFHETIIYFKRELDLFVKKRKDIIYRFNQSSIHFYDLTAIPNESLDEYTFKKSMAFENQKDKKSPLAYRQIPFTKTLTFKRKDMKKLSTLSFFLCFARISVRSDNKVSLNLSFLSDQEEVNDSTFMTYRIVDKHSIFNVNKIIKLKNASKAKIFLKGYANKEIKIDKVKAYCINFNDVKDF
jgi:hypothetical protein